MEFNLANILDKILQEETNPYYGEKTSRFENIKKIWNLIDKKQNELSKELFGDVSEQLDELTKMKMQLADRGLANGETNLKIPLRIVSAGNDKIPGNVMMINMSSALMCPSFFLGLCVINKGGCYAQRDENQYPNTRNRNFQTDLMYNRLMVLYKQGNKAPMQKYFRLVELYIQIGNAAAKNVIKEKVAKYEQMYDKPMSKDYYQAIVDEAEQFKIKYIRLNESGDFTCQTAVDLWTKFAKKMKDKYGIITHAYTARALDFSKASEHMAINPSHDRVDTGRNDKRTYIAVKTEFWNSLNGGDKCKNGQPILGKKNGKYFYKCPCDKTTHCDVCRVCFNPNKTGVPYTIYVKYHGMTAANGLKNLMTNQEMQPIMDYQANDEWTTSQEREVRKQSQKDLNKYSKNVLNQRKK